MLTIYSKVRLKTLQQIYNDERAIGFVVDTTSSGKPVIFLPRNRSGGHLGLSVNARKHIFEELKRLYGSFPSRGYLDDFSKNFLVFSTDNIEVLGLPKDLMQKVKEKFLDLKKDIHELRA